MNDKSKKPNTLTEGSIAPVPDPAQLQAQVSVKHALGIPDAYIMLNGGWRNDAVLKQVYRHTMEDAKRKTDSIAISHFENLMQHELQYETKKVPQIRYFSSSGREI